MLILYKAANQDSVWIELTKLARKNIISNTYFDTKYSVRLQIC